MGEPVRGALKIAYDGRSFYRHQRQPVHRTVEGECLKALRAAGILRDPKEAFFRSAVGNVIAFDSALPPRATIGAFNHRARDVWAWAVAGVPEGFHPRHAVERWYRYNLFEDLDLRKVRAAAREFVGEHDFRSFTSDPPPGRFRLDRVDVDRGDGMTRLGGGGRRFRRRVGPRVVAAIVAPGPGEVPLPAIPAAPRGARPDVGRAPPEPLVLMDVRYDVPFEVVLMPKVRDTWAKIGTDLELRRAFVRALRAAAPG